MLTTTVAAQPQVAGTGHRVVRQGRCGIGLVAVVRVEQQVIEFFGVEAGQAEIEVRRRQLLQFQSEQLVIPVRPRHRPVHHETERLYLGRGPFVAQNDRYLGDFQFARRFEAQMAVDHFAVAAGQHGTLEAEFPEAAAHAIHGGVILARVAGIEDEPVDGPALNLQGAW
jgi:hypothetical protein